MKLINKKEFISNIVEEYSASPKVLNLGIHKSTVELFEDINDSYMIEWDIPDLEITEHIGIFCYEQPKVISDYDGVFEIPSEIIEFLEENGFDCEYLKD